MFGDDFYERSKSRCLADCEDSPAAPLTKTKFTSSTMDGEKRNGSFDRKDRRCGNEFDRAVQGLNRFGRERV